MRYLVTGASKGLGKELTQQLLANKHSVVGISRTEPEFTSNPLFTHLCCDLTNATQRAELVVKLRDAEKFDVVLLNAGSTVADISKDGIHLQNARRVFELNYLANLELISALLQPNHPIHFVAVSSLSSVRASGVQGVGYPASKAAINLSFESLRLYYPSKTHHFSTVLLGKMKDGVQFQSGLSHSYCARKILSGIRKKQELIVLPWWKYLVLTLSKWIPDRLLRLAHDRA